MSCDSLEDPCIETPVGLVGWWPFSENSANPTATADIAGNNNGDRKNGAYSGCGVGPDFRGLGLDGINDYVEIPNSWVYLIQPNKSFMVDAWILAPPDVGDRMIIDKFSTSGFGIRLLLTGTGNLRGELRGSSGPVQGITFSPVQNLDDGNFHFVAMSLNRANNTLTLRADGLTNQLVLTPPGLIGGGSSLRIGAGRDAANLPIQFFEGCIDEVEFGRRDSSFEADLLEIYNQGVWESSPGKCKDACMVPWESFYCGNNSTLTTTLTICNYTNTPTLYSWWAEPVTTGPGCTGTPLAPNAFSPAAQQVTVPANKCMNYPITITEPSALPWGTACYKIHVMNMTNNTCCIAEGKVVDGKGIWIAPWNPLVDCIPTWPNQFIEFPTDCVRTVRFNIQNFFDSIGVLQYRLSVMPPEPGADIVSINGQAAGQIDSGTVFVTMGDTESVYIDANILFTDFGPLRAHDLLFDADIDHDGDFETLTSVALMNVSAYGVITAPTLTIWGDGGGVTLRWDGIPGAHHYVVFYSETDPAGPWIELGLTASTSFTDFFLIEDPPKRFYYVVAECAP